MHTDLTCHSPFQFQVHRNRTQVVRVLLENGADLTAQTDKGKTATDMADGKPEILTLLGVDAETAASSVAKEVDASGVGRVRAEWVLGCKFSFAPSFPRYPYGNPARAIVLRIQATVLIGVQMCLLYIFFSPSFLRRSQIIFGIQPFFTLTTRTKTGKTE